MKPKFLIGTGFYSKPEILEQNIAFADLWYLNTLKYVPDARMVCVSVGGTHPHFAPSLNIVRLHGNAGHIGQIMSFEKPYDYCGWTAAVMALCWMAYADESDFLWKEQDALCFGPWVESLYSELGNGKVIFGQVSSQAAAQSVFLVKHEYIPEFCHLYLECGPDGKMDAAGHWYNIPEVKFDRIARANPDTWKRWSIFGDRDRPIRVDEPVFYAQQITQGEIAFLKEKGFV